MGDRHREILNNRDMQVEALSSANMSGSNPRTAQLMFLHICSRLSGISGKV